MLFRLGVLMREEKLIMFIYKVLGLASFFLSQLLVADELIINENPKLGQLISMEDASQVDFVIMPNGDGLPQGSGDANIGKVLYDIQCIACHGKNAIGGINGDLAGGHGTINGPLPKKTVGSYWPYATILFDYIRRAMPYQMPGTLSNDEIYSLTAYILYLNDIISEDEVMSPITLPNVKMPNRDGFVWAYSPDRD